MPTDCFLPPYGASLGGASSMLGSSRTLMLGRLNCEVMLDSGFRGEREPEREGAMSTGPAMEPACPKGCADG